MVSTDLNRLTTVARIPFKDDEDAWGPDKVMVDQITSKGRLYHHGEVFPCTYEECKDLEICAVWHISHVVDMLMGEDKWDRCMKRPKDV